MQDYEVALKLVKEGLYTVSKFFNKARKISDIQSLKFHGMVPLEGRGDCGESPKILSYLPFIESSNGVAVHCKGEDYSKFISKMLAFSKFGSKIIDIPEDKVSMIDYVELDGQSVKFEVLSDKSQVVVYDVPQLTGEEHIIEIFYKI